MTENLVQKTKTDRSFYNVMREGLNSDEFKDLKIEMGRKHGFLKHADRDESDIIDVNDKQAAAILYFASENYTHLFKEQSSQMLLIKTFIYACLGRRMGIEENYLEQIAHFELIAQQEGMSRLKEVIGNQLREYNRHNKGSDRSTHKI